MKVEPCIFSHVIKKVAFLNLQEHYCYDPKHFFKDFNVILTKELNDIQFYFHGSGRMHWINTALNFLNSSNCFNVDYIEDFITFNKNIDIVVMPLSAGAGVKNILLNSIYLNKIVFGSEEAFSGIPSKLADNFIISSANELMNKLQYLNDIKKNYLELRNYVLEHHDISMFKSDLKRFWVSVMSKIIIDGGLGNQLFQLAWAIYLKRKYNIDTKIELSFLKKKKQHNYVDYRKIIREENLPISEYEKNLPLLFDGYQGKVFRTFMRSFNITSFRDYLLYDYNADMNFSIAESLKKCEYQIGYFQFVDSALFIRNYLLENILNRNEVLHKRNNFDFYLKKIGIHVRRGDFLKSSNKKHTIIDFQFIKKAMCEYPTDAHFVIFSDDIEWAKENIKDNNIHYSLEKTVYDDFYALSNCSSYILSGSTFGWWAAFLSDNFCNKKVVLPEHNAQFMSKESNEKIGWFYQYV
ncbi:alpha-1,2-fucosyltransferase [Photorhabdus luminescens]|uniref:Alpha-1,2-fucosyltransferase n=1 Tax=Photorhabdus luminescens subsp. sonorensis TaxID=1173677 RepID=A0A5C4RNU5_PHOLU|nr:alpha-1,2-fucosyltransferase [Photorhabdus luminescens]TNH45197.1 hypothetical protein EP164_00445 [Photorhabdus luminescens subsp. sonorensis]